MKNNQTKLFIQELTKLTYSELQEYILTKGQPPKAVTPFYFTSDNKLLHK